MSARARTPRHRPVALMLTTFLSVLALAAATIDAAKPASASSAHSGTVRVLSAGSLSNVMTLLGAGFRHDTGYTLVNTPMGSSALAHGISSRTLQGDVFISASIAVDQSLEGAAHGDWINGYTEFGTSPDVLAYYRGSAFASALRLRPWYEVVTHAGFLLGRTDPAVDPGGVLDLDALRGLGYAYNLSALLDLAQRTRDVYAEEAIPGLLTAGQLDGAFMYAVAAHAAALPYVALSGTRNLSAHFTVATLKGAPDAAAATSFVHWLLSARGASIMIQQGLVPTAHPRFVAAHG